MTVVYILLGVLAVYLVFAFLPSVVMFRKIFYLRGKCCKPKPEPQKSYYAPFQAIRQEAQSYLAALPAQELTIHSHDGLVLKADYYSGGCSRTAVLLHGYRASPMSNCAYQAAKLHQAGYNVLLAYQRGHGKSGGRFTTLGDREQLDAMAWVDRAAAEPGVAHVIAYGVSMGAVALAHASDKIEQRKLRALVLDCGFTSTYQQLCHDAQKNHIPPVAVVPPVGLFYRLRFGTDVKKPVTEALKNTKIPALFLHGTADSSVPFLHGQHNFEACASEKKALFVEGADHTCALLQGGQDTLNQMFNFLDKYTIQLKEESDYYE